MPPRSQSPSRPTFSLTLFLAMAGYDLRARYASSLFGVGWAVLHPALLFLLYLFVFSVVLDGPRTSGRSPGHVVLHMMCGFLPWLAISEGLHRAGSCLLENRGLLRKARFPAEVLPAVAVVNASLVELVGLGIVALYTTATTWPPNGWLVALPFVLALRVGLTLGLAWLLSLLNVVVRDVGQVLGFVLTVWLFLTPIFYPPSALPSRLGWLQTLNPLHQVAESYRAILILGQPPPVVSAVALVVSAGLATAAGWGSFRRSIENVKGFL